MKKDQPKNLESLLERFQRNLSEKEKLIKKINTLYEILAEIYGADKLILKAGKLESLALLRSEKLEDKILGLRRIVMEDPTLENDAGSRESSKTMEEIEERVSDLLARKAVEESLQEKMNLKMKEKHDEYLQDMKVQILKDQNGPENAGTLKKLASLKKKEKIHLSRTVMEILRPSTLEEIIGQEKAIQSLLSKLAAPYPQHVIIYGPPGVGKTTVARLALQEAKKLPFAPFCAQAPFVEVDGTTLRWDPREASNPLLGSVHDPIYQGARRELVEGGIPEPKPGLVTEAHGGVLFIDEIGEIDRNLQSKLLKVLEDKRVYFDSAYYDPNERNVPEYIRKLFNRGAPADFILIGATTRNPTSISPAIRSRATEVYFEPLAPEDIIKIVEGAAEKLKVNLEPGVTCSISRYTIEGRKAINILSDAYGLALYRQARQGMSHSTCIRVNHILEVIQAGRLLPYGQVKDLVGEETGKMFGLGSWGYTGVVLEIEASVFPSTNGRGSVRFNDTAGSMAKDSFFNAATAIRYLTGTNLNQYDVHVNVVGGGNIEGPSAGAAILLALYSAIKERPVPKEIAVTGEITLRGKIKPVGGVQEKIYGARMAGIKKVYIPAANYQEIAPGLQFKDLEVKGVESAEELLRQVF